MSNDVKVSQVGMTKEEVGLELLKLIKYHDKGSNYNNKDQILDLYAECLIATNNHRELSDN